MRKNPTKYSLFLFPLVLEHAIPSFFMNSFYTTLTSECVKSKINIQKRRLFINLIESKCGNIKLLELIYNQLFMKVSCKRISYILKCLFFSYIYVTSLCLREIIIASISYFLFSFVFEFIRLIIIYEKNYWFQTLDIPYQSISCMCLVCTINFTTFVS